MPKDMPRHRNLLSHLRQNKLDALICFHPENVLLATTIYPGAPFTVAILTATGKSIIISPWWRENEIAKEDCVNDILTFDWLKNLTGVDPVDAILTHLKAIRKKYRLRSIGHDGSFGCLMPNCTPSSCFTYEPLKTALSSCFNKSKDVTSDLYGLRAIKTDYEIARIRKAAGVAKKAAHIFYTQAIAGRREVELAAEILRTVQSQAGQNGCRFTYCDPPQITSGVRRTLHANALTCPATSRKLRKKELVMLELGGCVDGYWFDLTRTLVVEAQPTPQQSDMADAIREASRAAIKSYQQGTKTGHEITQAAFEVLHQRGFQKGIVHGLGHGLGFAYHETTPFIGPGSGDVIKAGMITSMEPGLYLKQVGGIRIEHNILWQKNRTINLTNFHDGLGPWPTN